MMIGYSSEGGKAVKNTFCLGIIISQFFFLNLAFSKFRSIPIIHGTRVSSSEPIAKTTVAFLPDGSEGCSGVIIASDIIVTAAHCVEDGVTSVMRVGFGLDLHKGITKLRVKGFVAHPGFKNIGNLVENDIALVRLAEALPAGYEAAPILPPSFEPKTQDTIVIAGYGDAIANDYSSYGILRKGTEAFVSANVLGNSAEFLTDGSGLNSTCGGDSGGPAYYYVNGIKYLYGVTSRGAGMCNAESIYTKVNAHADWIVRTIAQLHAIQ